MFCRFLLALKSDYLAKEKRKRLFVQVLLFRKDLKNLETEKELAKKERKCEEYIIDIDEERAKLEKRKCAIEMLITYYEEIRAAISSGCVELLNDAVIL